MLAFPFGATPRRLLCTLALMQVTTTSPFGLRKDSYDPDEAGMSRLSNCLFWDLVQVDTQQSTDGGISGAHLVGAAGCAQICGRVFQNKPAGLCHGCGEVRQGQKLGDWQETVMWLVQAKFGAMRYACEQAHLHRVTGMLGNLQRQRKVTRNNLMDHGVAVKTLERAHET